MQQVTRHKPTDNARSTNWGKLLAQTAQSTTEYPRDTITQSILQHHISLGKNNIDGTNANGVSGSNTGNNPSNNNTTNNLTSRNNVLGDVSINANVENCNPRGYRSIASNNRSFNHVTQKYEFNCENLLISSVSLVDDIVIFQEKTNVFDALHLSNANAHFRYLPLAERDESGARDGNNATTLNDNCNKMFENKQTTTKNKYLTQRGRIRMKTTNRVLNCQILTKWMEQKKLMQVANNHKGIRVMFSFEMFCDLVFVVQDMLVQEVIYPNNKNESCP